MLKEFVKAVSKVVGAFVLLIIFIVPASLLHAHGYELAGAVLGWIGTGIFLLSLFYILVEPFVESFRK